MHEGGYVVVDCQSGFLDRSTPLDVAAALVRQTLPELLFNLDIHGEAFGDRFLVLVDWRAKQHERCEVTKH